MSLRQHMSRLANGWQAAHRIARAIVRLESYVTAAALEALRSAGSGRNPLLAFGAKPYSQNDEDGLIEEITRRTMGDRPGDQLVACNLTGANAFFVRDDLAARFPEVPDEWERLYMPATYLRYPAYGHPPSLRTVQSLLG